MNKEQKVVKKYLSVCKKNRFKMHCTSVNLYTGNMCCVLHTSEHLRGTGDRSSVWNSSQVSRQPDWRVTVSGHFDTMCILFSYRFSVKNQTNDRRRAVSRLVKIVTDGNGGFFSLFSAPRSLAIFIRFSLISLAYSNITVTSQRTAAYWHLRGRCELWMCRRITNGISTGFVSKVQTRWW